MKKNMKIKRLLILTLLILPLQIISAQNQIPYSSISSGGGKISSTLNIIEYTLGESIVGKTSSSINIMSMGFWNMYHQDVLTAVEGDEELPLQYKLEQNYPNPFNPSTTIKFAVPERSNVLIKIYDILGREVATPVNEELEAGWHEYNFNASNLSSGVYLFRMETKKFISTKKMILIK